MVGVPAQLPAADEECGAQVGVASPVADVPLPARHDLERSVALLVELHGVGDRARLADHLAGRAEQLDDRGLSLLRGFPGERCVVLDALRVGDALGCLGENTSVPADDRARGQLQLAPPDDVGDVAEGADHCDAGSLVDLGERVREDRHLHVEQRCAHGGSEHRLVPVVVGVRDECDARRQQFGPGGVDRDVTRTVGLVERECVVRTGTLAVLELGLRDGRLEVDVPQCRCLLRVGLAPGEVAEESAL